MLTDEQKIHITNSWRLVVPIAATAADLFYKRLFELRPDYVEFFPTDMSRQKDKLVAMLDFIVKSLNWKAHQWREDIDPDEDLFLVVLALGRRHGQLYKIPADSYGPVGQALIWTLDYGLGEAFTAEVKEAWLAVFTLLSKTMLMGSRVRTPEADEVPGDE